ncbi:MAG: carbohydrate porin [Cyanobacteria bacterium P01_A01_bin.84]
MSQSVYQCYKFVSEKQHNKVCPLLCSVSISIVWVMTINNCAIAQQSTSELQQDNLQSQERLKVPSSPPNQRYSTSDFQEILPPQEGTGGIAVNSSQPVPVENIKQLEQDFIEQMTNQSSSPAKSSGSNKSKERNLSTDLPKLAASEDNPSFSFLTLRQQDSQEKISSQIQLQSSQGRIPTFNQLLYPNSASSSSSSGSFSNSQNNSQRTSQTQEFVAPASPIPPLPPLPGENIINATTNVSPLTFNQLLNSRWSSPKIPQQTFAKPKFSTPGNVEQVTTKPFSVNSINPSFPKTQRVIQRPLIEPNITEQSQNQFQNSSQRVPENNQLPAQISNEPLKQPSLKFEGVYRTQDDETSARARLTGIYPLSPQALFGATLDLTSEGSNFDDSRREGLNINELYFATSLTGVPNLRFAVGQLDLTSYFDRNSFAKDGASQFFNPVFQTNPALAATGISSRTGMLVNWSVADNIDAKAAVFSSSDKLSDFTLDGFAGEIGIRYGNAIIRGTYATSRDAGNRDTFPESFGIARNNGEFGTLEDDREEAYGVNAEFFIPKVKLGLFARYGRYENRDLGEGADTYVLGASFLDVFTKDDRLGLAYGRELSNDSLRNGDYPDVVELFYDFQFVPNLRLGFTVQGRDSFEETVLGVRVRSAFDITPKRRDSR